MSRSYKKNPYITDNNCSAWGKKEANRKVRRTKGLSDGGAYKKAYQSYNIRDFKFVYCDEEYQGPEYKYRMK